MVLACSSRTSDASPLFPGGAVFAALWSSAVVSALAVALTACSATQHTTPVVYVALGDSMTVGKGVDQQELDAYPALLSRYLSAGSLHRNLAVNGVTLGTGITGQLPHLLTANPTLVTVWFGINDLRHATPSATYQAALGHLLTVLEGIKAQAFLANMPDVSSLSPAAGFSSDASQLVRSYNASIDALASRHRAHVVDMYASTTVIWRSHGNAQPDGLHLTALGQAAVARIFYDVLHNNSAL